MASSDVELSSTSGAAAAVDVPTSAAHAPVHVAGGTVPPEMEEVFLTMHYRKMQRDLNGPQKKQSKYHYVALACMLILIYGLSAYQRGETNLPEEGGGGGGGEQIEENAPIAIVLSVPQIALIGVWIFVSIVVTGIFEGTKVIHLLYWMVVYFPLLAMLASALFHDNVVIKDTTWIVVALIIAEVITVLAFVLTYYAYPKLVTSRWFRERYGASRYFRIVLLDDWTMEYDGRWGRCSRRYVCRYVGEVNDDGLPHGRGVWSDDSTRTTARF